jgi:hypothetical protein
MTKRANTLPTDVRQPEGAFTPRVIDTITKMLARPTGVLQSEIRSTFKDWNSRRVRRYMATVANGLQGQRVRTAREGRDTRYTVGARKAGKAKR